MSYAIGDRVLVNTGRNSGRTGTITHVSNTGAYVDFGGHVEVREWLSSGPSEWYPDGYWVIFEKMRKSSENK